MLKNTISNLFIVLALFSIVALPSCSTRKSTFFTRTYHHTTTKYNWYFNGNESFKAGVKKLEESKKEDFNQILPIFILPSQNEVQSISSSMDRAIKKGASAIAKHSILIKGTEHNKSIDETYLLIGNAYLYKLDFIKAIEAYSFTAKQFEGLKTAYQASINLARTYVLKKDYVSAEIVIDQLINDQDFPMSLNKDLSLVYADYYFQQGELRSCIEELKQALSQSEKKKEKVRLSYILAQIYYELEDYAQSSNYFKSVVKKGPSYDFEFNAKINLARSYDVAQGNNQEIESELNKMIKDKKNKEYLDVIYFGLAELKFRQQQQKQAINLYKLSVAKSIDNDAQKALSSLILGEIFYDDKLYRPSQSYYDTAVAYMDSQNPKYKSTQKRQTTLSLLIENLDIISREDSLQKIAAMPESQRNSFIDGLIAKLKEQERLEKQQAQSNKNESAFLNGNQNSRTNNRFNQSQSRGGVWYFYNPTTLSFGFSEFGRKWGKRKLEDNWRRSNKKSFGIEDLESDQELEEEFDPNNRESYIAQLPLTVEQIKASNKKIIESYYSAAIIYKEDLEDPPLSLQTFEELNQRFPKNDNQVKVLYFLYRLNLSLEKKKEASKYKELLLELFPQSDYAKIISDKSYLEILQQSKPTIDVLYESTYQKYLLGQYKQVVSDCVSANTNHKGNLLSPRFDLLHALASGHVQGKNKMILLLQKVIENHPNHEVAVSAQDILDQFQTELSDKDGSDSQNKDIYSYEPDSPHYFILLFKEFDLTLNIAKSTLSDYHSQFYSLEKLNVSSILLDKETNMITVRQFENAKKAMIYYNAFQTGDARGPFGDNYQSFVISQSNFPLFYQSKEVDKYLLKFKEFYQSKQ